MHELHALLSRQRLTASGLAEIHAALHSRADFTRELIRLIPLLDPEFVCRPLGLLRMAAQNDRLEKSEITRLVGHIDAMTHWLARLLLCQLLSVTGCPAIARDDAFPFLADCFEDRRVIVRAWALTALTGFNVPEHQKAIARMVARAKKDPSKAMQARLRQITPTIPLR